MAVDFKVEHQRTSEYMIAPEKIKFKPELNGRHDLPDIEWLIASMVKIGQLESVLVRSDGGIPVLVAGFSRWRAAIEINRRKLTPKPFRLKCSYFKGSEQQGVLANIAENRERNTTTQMDDAYNIARLERYGMSLEEIAQEYHEDTDWCKKRLALISLTEEAQQAVKDGTVKPSATVALAKLSEEAQRKAVKDAKAAGKKITPATVKRAAPAPVKAQRTLREKIEDAAYNHESLVVRAFCQELLDGPKKTKKGRTV